MTILLLIVDGKPLKRTTQVPLTKDHFSQQLKNSGMNLLTPSKVIISKKHNSKYHLPLLEPAIFINTKASTLPSKETPHKRSEYKIAQYLINEIGSGMKEGRATVQEKLIVPKSKKRKRNGVWKKKRVLLPTMVSVNSCLDSMTQCLLRNKVFIKDKQSSLQISQSVNCIDLDSMQDIDSLVNPLRNTLISSADKFICGLVSRRQSLDDKKEFPRYMKYFQMGLKNKPDVGRSDKRIGIQSRFVCHGFRKNDKDSYVGTYAYKSNCPDETKEILNKEFNRYAFNLEKKALQILKLLPDWEVFKDWQNHFQIPSMNEGGVYTQFCFSCNYASPVHIDKDYFYSAVSVLADGDVDNQTILQYFCFPSFNMVVPLRKGDVLVFDPRVPHCATPSRIQNSFIASLYVSKKTCDTKVAENHV